MTRFLREVFSPALEFVRNFGAMTLFFVQLLRYTPWTLVRRFGLVVEEEGPVFRVEPQQASASSYTVESDWSGAGYWYSLLGLAKEGDV